MKILCVGEIVAGPGRKAVEAALPEIIKEHKVDFVFSNCENLVSGRGFTEEKIQDMQKVGIDFFTGGDHIFWQKESEDAIDRLPIIRPANYPEGTPGVGHKIVDLGKKGEILMINLMGRTSFSTLHAYLEDPFRTADAILKSYEDRKFSAIIVDFHAEATSEKYALAHYLDGRVDIFVGSHTHVPTCDEIIMPKGTLYITDVGMTGSIDSVLGVESKIIINMFMTARNQRFDWEEHGRKAFRSVLFDTDNKEIKRIDRLI
ncbi:MAG: metallophosphoesterase [Patescibacteria group bacterium]|nr:MAG: metallophosphoesterase [Patescibacteria group bacterium]